MAVLGVVVLHARVVRRVFGIFFHVMRRRVRHHAGCRDGVANVTGQVYATLATPNLPRAAITSREHELIGAIAFGQAARYRPYIRLRFGITRLILRYRP